MQSMLKESTNNASREVTCNGKYYRSKTSKSVTKSNESSIPVSSSSNAGPANYPGSVPQKRRSLKERAKSLAFTLPKRNGLKTMKSSMSTSEYSSFYRGCGSPKSTLTEESKSNLIPMLCTPDMSPSDSPSAVSEVGELPALHKSRPMVERCRDLSFVEYANQIVVAQCLVSPTETSQRCSNQAREERVYTQPASSPIPLYKVSSDDYGADAIKALRMAQEETVHVRSKGGSPKLLERDMSSRNFQKTKRDPPPKPGVFEKSSSSRNLSQPGNSRVHRLGSVGFVGLSSEDDEKMEAVVTNQVMSSKVLDEQIKGIQEKPVTFHQNLSEQRTGEKGGSEGNMGRLHGRSTTICSVEDARKVSALRNTPSSLLERKQSLEPCDVASCYASLPPGGATISSQVNKHDTRQAAEGLAVDYTRIGTDSPSYLLKTKKSPPRVRVAEIQKIMGHIMIERYGKPLPLECLERIKRDGVLRRSKTAY